MVKKIKTFQQKKETVKRQWHVVDIKDAVLGRQATQIATLLMGKHKTVFTPHVDTGDYVVVVNASQVAITGNKRSDKTYYRHSQYPGGLKKEQFDELLDRDPVQVIKKAVYGMLPKNKLRTDRMKRLKVFTGPEHLYQENVKKSA